MGELTEGVNWLAIIVGTVLGFLLGWLWYSEKLFGKKWAAGVGIEYNSSGPAPVAMVAQFAGTFLLSWLIGVTAASNSLLTAILIVATIVCLFIASGLFCKKSSYSIAAECGYIVVMAVIMIVCQGIF